MTLELTALSPADGWAIARDETGYVLLRPPYRRADLSAPAARLGPIDVRRALEREGFQADGRAFTDWGALVRTVRDAFVAATDPAAFERAAQTAAEVLRYATAEDVVEHLNHVDRALGEGNTHGAFNLLCALSNVPVVLDSLDLLRQVNARLARSAAHGPKATGHLRTSDDAWFPSSAAASTPTEPPRSFLDFAPRAAA